MIAANRSVSPTLFRATGAQPIAVGYRFHMIMLTDGAKSAAPEMQVRDVAEKLNT